MRKQNEKRKDKSLSGFSPAAVPSLAPAPLRAGVPDTAAAPARAARACAVLGRRAGRAEVAQAAAWRDRDRDRDGTGTNRERRRPGSGRSAGPASLQAQL